jgi:hypothetical protein
MVSDDNFKWITMALICHAGPVVTHKFMYIFLELEGFSIFLWSLFRLCLDENKTRN